MVQVKASHLIGSLVTMLMAIGGTGLSFWQDTRSGLDKNALEIQHTNDLINQRLSRIERSLDRIETAAFNANSNPIPNQSKNHQP